jgi:hypothetical protein
MVPSHVQEKTNVMYSGIMEYDGYARRFPGPILTY